MPKLPRYEVTSVLQKPFLYGTRHIACVQILKVVQKCFMPKPITILVVFKTQRHHGINKDFRYRFFSVSNNSSFF